jgi:hypothetical protein
MSRNVLAAMGLMLAISSTLFSQQITFTDNFDDGNIDEWTRFDIVEFFTGGQPHSSITFPNGGVKIQSPTTGPMLPPGGGAILRPDLVFSDFEMSVDIVEDLGSDSGSIFGLGARGQAPFFTYLLLAGKAEPSFFPDAAGKTVFGMTRLAGEDQLELGMTFAEVPDDAGLKMVFRGEGSNLTGELFSLRDLSTPVATLTAEDSMYAAGYGEIFVADAVPPDGTRFLDAFADVTFDNFSLTATVPEPSTLALCVFGLAGLARRRCRRYFAEQTKPPRLGRYRLGAVWFRCISTRLPSYSYSRRKALR